jgi:hypothetical protein
MEIIEETEFANSKYLDLSYAGKDNLILYPNIPVQLQCEFDENEFELPENADGFGKVYFMCSASNEVEAELPIYFSSGE